MTDNILRLVPNTCGDDGAFSSNEILDKVKNHITEHGNIELSVIGRDADGEIMVFSTHNTGSLFYLMDSVKHSIISNQGG